MSQTERETPISAIEQLDVEVREYLRKNAERGSVSYMAFMDYFHQNELQNGQRFDLEEVMKEENPMVKAALESDLRLTEAELALIHHQIHNRSTELPGYFYEIMYFEDVFSRLRQACTGENAQQEYDNFRYDWKEFLQERE